MMVLNSISPGTHPCDTIAVQSIDIYYVDIHDIKFTI